MKENRRAWLDLLRPLEGGFSNDFYVIEDGGHSWPGSQAMASMGDAGGIASIIGATTMEVSATPLLWDFYQRHPLAS